MCATKSDVALRKENVTGLKEKKTELHLEKQMVLEHNRYEGRV